MPFDQLVVLALIQGLTEFLPISSSGHLVLAPHLFGWEDQGLSYDIAAHAGTLLAVVTWFRHDLLALVSPLRVRLFGGLAPAPTAGSPPPMALLIWLGAATLPVCVVGLLGKDFIETNLRSPEVIAATTILFGLVLGLSDWLGARRDPLEKLGVWGALWVGLAQVLALIPGTSRSGITMTAGLFLGLRRTDAARFSFLMSIPVIFLASALETLDLLNRLEQADWSGLAVVFVLSALAAAVCIWAFLRILERVGMWPFVIYRLGLGVFLLMWFK